MQKTAAHTVFISTEALTIDAIIGNNKQIQLIYQGKHGIPIYRVIAPKLTGSMVGTVFEKTPSKSTKIAQQWLGKVGATTKDYLTPDSCFEVQRVSNLDVIREKLAFDLYLQLGKGCFLLPKTRLSEQDILDEFTPSVPKLGFTYLLRFARGGFLKTSLRIMSKYIVDYQDLGKALVLGLDGQQISFIEFIKTYRRPPTHVMDS